MKKPIMLGTILFFSACGGANETESHSIARESDAVEKPALNTELWAGDWRLRDNATNQVVAHLEFRVRGEQLEGQYSLTKNFCQTTHPEKSSYCPFSGQGGTWYEIDTSPTILIAKGPDPFEPKENFVVTLISVEQDTVAMSSIISYPGFVSIDASVEKVPG